MITSQVSSCLLLALLVCTTFVLFLLRLERRESAGVSAALWIPALWMLAIASKALAIWFGRDRGHGRVLVAMWWTRSVAAR